MKVRGTSIELSIDGVELPSEFRLFKAGWNDTEKGSFLFDEEAARLVMAASQKWGVDHMIDLEHQALDGATPPEPTARDARGWFRLELRTGELWAVNVKWTPDGQARLSERRQRYVSPAFTVDPETKRITSITNVAITAIPATHDTPALIAASAINGECMDPELLKQAMDALIAGDAEKCMEILKGIITGAAGAEEASEAEVAPVEEMAVEAPAEEEKKEEVAAASARLLRITARTTFVGALDEVETWRQSHIRLEAREAELAAERAALEYGKRKENAIAFTKLGAETPATTGLNKGKLCKRLLDEPLDEQNTRLAELLASRGGKLPADPITARRETPESGGKEFKTPLGPYTLSAKQMKFCEETKADPQIYANNMMIHLKAKGG